MTPKVYLLDTAQRNQEDGEFTERLEELCASLSQERQSKIRRFRFLQGRLLSLGAGFLLDYGLRQYGLRERDVTIAYKENGKPYLPDYPEIHFNLSHSGTMAMASFARQEVGCDIEQIRSPNLRVAQRFFAAGETKVLEDTQDLQERTKYFYRFWTLKESFLKVTGKGIQMPLNEFCIQIEPPIRVEVQGKRLNYNFWEFSLPGYCAALCTEAEDNTLCSPPLLEKVSW